MNSASESSKQQVQGSKCRSGGAYYGRFRVELNFPCGDGPRVHGKYDGIVSVPTKALIPFLSSRCWFIGSACPSRHQTSADRLCRACTSNWAFVRKVKNCIAP